MAARGQSEKKKEIADGKSRNKTNHMQPKKKMSQQQQKIHQETSMIHHKKSFRKTKKQRSTRKPKTKNATEGEEAELQTENQPRQGRGHSTKQKKHDNIQERRRKTKKAHRKRSQKDEGAERRNFIDRRFDIPEESEEERQKYAKDQPGGNQEQNADRQPSEEGRQDQADTRQIEER